MALIGPNATKNPGGCGYGGTGAEGSFECFVVKTWPHTRWRDVPSTPARRKNNSTKQSSPWHQRAECVDIWTDMPVHSQCNPPLLFFCWWLTECWYLAQRIGRVMVYLHVWSVKRHQWTASIACRGGINGRFCQPMGPQKKWGGNSIVLSTWWFESGPK